MSSTGRDTPDSEYVESVYTEWHMWNTGVLRKDIEAEYERFIAQVKHTAAREALDGLADYSDRRVDGLAADGWYRASDTLLAVAREAKSYRLTHYPEGNE